MQTKQESLKSEKVIPNVKCPRCDSLMRLASIEPAAMSGRETLVFECTCGFAYKRPVSSGL